MPPAGERQILMSPDVVARAAAAMAPDREARWMLRQPRELRQSFAEDVLGAADRELAQEVWMLQQPLAVRLSFLEDVLAYDPKAPREQVWMLRQSDEVCLSYVDEVLLPGEGA
jgi:hypothetical protein